ncbi:MAG: hypothetical protein BWY09_01546 [Candidatus Hydrogenedentes bacterium ADurb.Bin179]|nr:MAG: hypothetical protein BWY09_01546 [Candidatus Hydrogenedentes bacterium ADurb.Bin179]
MLLRVLLIGFQKGVAKPGNVPVTLSGARIDSHPCAGIANVLPDYTLDGGPRPHESLQQVGDGVRPAGRLWFPFLFFFVPRGPGNDNHGFQRLKHGSQVTPQLFGVAGGLRYGGFLGGFLKLR